MKRFFIWASLLSGAAAAYLMYRRGESLATIARKISTHPVSTLATELKTAL